MTTSDQLLSEFIDAWNAGDRPDVDRYLERVPVGEREELAGLLHTFLLDAPTPRYSDETVAELRSDPLVNEIGALLERGLWAGLLPALRRRARKTRDQVVTELSELLHVSGREEKVKRYYHEMETGMLDPAGVSHSVLDALARILRVRVEQLEETDPFTPHPPALADSTFFRSVQHSADMEMEHLETPSHAAGPAGAETGGEMDEVDRLFRGGR